MVKYSLMKPMITSGKLIGYRVLDNNTNSVKKVKLDDIYKLIDKNLVNGEILLDSEGNRHIYIDTLRDIDIEQETYEIVYRIVVDNKLVGYKCKSSNNEFTEVTPMKLWELASVGRVVGIKAKIINDKPVITSDGISLLDIRCIK